MVTRREMSRGQCPAHYCNKMPCSDDHIDYPGKPIPEKTTVLLFDMDNVLNYFDVAVLEYLNSKRKKDDQIPEPQIKTWDFWLHYGQYYPWKTMGEFNQHVKDPMFADYDFWMSIAPRGDAIRVYKEYRASQDYRTYIVTRAAYIGGYNGKINWLRQIFGFEEILNEVIFTSDKTMIQGHYLIDDNLMTIGHRYENPAWRFVHFDVHGEGWTAFEELPKVPYLSVWEKIKEKEGLENGMKRLFPLDKVCGSDSLLNVPIGEDEEDMIFSSEADTMHFEAIRFEPIVGCTTARPPRKHYEDDVGFDLFAKEDDDVILQANTKHTIRTGVRVVLPKRTYGRVAPRSSLADKGVWINGGVIDNGFSGELKVIMHNMTDKEIRIKDGIAIAQLIPTVYESCHNVLHNGWSKKQMNDAGVVKHHPLMDTVTHQRGDKGFGSTNDSVEDHDVNY